MGKILVVDDEKEIADLLEVYLQNDGFTGRKAYNGTDALKYFVSHLLFFRKEVLKGFRKKYLSYCLSVDYMHFFFREHPVLFAER